MNFYSLLKIIISDSGKNSTEYALCFKRFISNESLLLKTLNLRHVISQFLIEKTETQNPK
jgi:hypothetical protein